MRKFTKKYYFSVEGETEQWYLEWLQNTINATEQSKYNVSFNVKVEKNPLKYVKKINIMSNTLIYHFSDYESDEEIHTEQFKETIDNLVKAKNSGRQIEYCFGYSNLTFDLWIILHRTDKSLHRFNRHSYMEMINRAYNKKFEDMHEYKHEDNFKNILKSLTIDDVKRAINSAKTLMKNNELNGYRLVEYKKYKYYKENPSLMVWEAIENVLHDCGL